MKGAILTAWMLEMGIITYRGAKQGKFTNNPVSHLALPSEYVATFIIYGALGLIPGQGEKVAAIFGWGIVAATLLNLWDPSTIGQAAGPTVKGATAPATPTVTTPAGG